MHERADGTGAVVLSVNRGLDLCVLVRLVSMARTSASSARMVVVDMSRMTSFDDNGVDLLHKAQQLAETYGVTLRIVTDDASAATRVLEETGLHRRLARYDSVIQALHPTSPAIP